MNYLVKKGALNLELGVSILPCIPDITPKIGIVFQILRFYGWENGCRKIKMCQQILHLQIYWHIGILASLNVVFRIFKLKLQFQIDICQFHPGKTLLAELFEERIGIELFHVEYARLTPLSGHEH
ncbi:MAG: hypothetical protein H6Q17_1548 [Bacteroidetes bacterium]|nr:hypothetical protein [Bacteroidota bacterium]